MLRVAQASGGPTRRHSPNRVRYGDPRRLRTARLFTTPSCRPGDRWNLPHPLGHPAWVTAGREEVVRVPAESFTAVPVEVAVTSPPETPTVRARYWYARGVGLVQGTSPDGEEVVLTAFSPSRS